MRGLTRASSSFFAFRNVDHDDLLVNIDLRRRQADARRLVHGFSHVGDQTPHAESSILTTGAATFFKRASGKRKMGSRAMGNTEKSLLA
jgi:hypothetical protein